MRAMIAGLAVLALVACASQKTWYKQGASNQDFRMDQGQCQAQAYSASGAPMFQVMAVYGACMRGKGWELI